MQKLTDMGLINRSAVEKLKTMYSETDLGTSVIKLIFFADK
jgi:DNA-binding HxlR family transcriptional regulator